MQKNLTSLFTALITVLSISLSGCASYNGGGDAAGWAHAENEMIIAGIVMAPIAIALTPITLPASLIQNSLNNHDEFEQQELNKHMRNAIVQTAFLPLDDNQFSFPALSFHHQTYHAWIPVMKNEISNPASLNRLEQQYHDVFENVVNQSQNHQELSDGWRAYQYDNKNWMFFSEQCEPLGINNGKNYQSLTSQMKQDFLTIKLQQLCETPQKEN